MSNVRTGLDRLLNDTKLQSDIKGRIGYLCHAASINSCLEPGPTAMKRVFGDRLVSLFTPQHGLYADVQANMIETRSGYSSYYKLPVHSLYSETRTPSREMLDAIDTLVIDLQDVGTRIYTYVHTMTLAMEACAKQGKRVVVLDRPNPINGITLEGISLDPAYASFVGRHPVPMRHGLTMGEMAGLAAKRFGSACELQVVEMVGWKRDMSFEDTGLEFVPPSPNIPIVQSCYPYVGTVMLEGVQLSEGRGTTRPFEIIGHPKLDAFSLVDDLHAGMKRDGLTGAVLRPAVFIPTFDKFKGESCGGFHLHITDRKAFRPWLFTCWLLREVYKRVGNSSPFWRPPPYEYEYKLMPIDILAGDSSVRTWVESNAPLVDLKTKEARDIEAFDKVRSEFFKYGMK